MDCPACKKDKHINDFYWEGPNGTKRIFSICKKCTDKALGIKRIDPKKIKCPDDDPKPVGGYGCPRCGCLKIYTEGNRTTHEIYCAGCFYHFNGAERRTYRTYLRKNKLKHTFPPNMQMSDEEIQQIIKQNDQKATQDYHKKNPKGELFNKANYLLRLEYYRKYNEEHKEEKRAYGRAYYHKNKREILERRREKRRAMKY